MNSRRLHECRHGWHPAFTGFCGQNGLQHRHWKINHQRSATIKLQLLHLDIRSLHIKIQDVCVCVCVFTDPQLWRRQGGTARWARCLAVGRTSSRTVNVQSRRHQCSLWSAVNTQTVSVSQTFKQQFVDHLVHIVYLVSQFLINHFRGHTNYINDKKNLCV